MTNPTGKAKVVFSTDGSISFTPPIYTGIYLSFSYPENLLISSNAVFSSVRGSVSGGALRIKTDFGDLNVGAQNTSWAHIYTDRLKFIFNKPVYSLNGEFSAYDNSNLSIQTNGTTRMTVLHSNGNVGIGTVNPTSKLEVSGRARIIGDVYVNGANALTFQDDARFSVTPTHVPDLNIANFSMPHYGIAAPNAGSSADLWLSGNNAIRFFSGGNPIPVMNLTNNGKVGIGTTQIPGDYKLAIAGNVIAEEVVVKLQSAWPWPDFVFHQDYTLKPLHEVEQFVKTNKHLPGIPSAAQVEKEGLNMGEMQSKLLQKVEELMLYIIEQDKKIKQLEEKLK